MRRQREAQQMRGRRLSLERIVGITDWQCGSGPIVRGFGRDAGRQVNNLADTQLIYVGQLRVRFDEIINCRRRSEITNGNLLERITGPDRSLTELLRRCG